MPRRLPNLNALRAFDAAARHLSFTLAAEELSVTQAAVSRHIRLLERDLGHALFERHHRKIVLTTIGRRYAKVVEQAFLSLALDTGSLPYEQPGPVVIDVDSDLAELWLIPQMAEGAFEELGVALDVRAHPEPSKKLTTDADLSITWSKVDMPGFSCEPYLEYTAFPVCAPELANGKKPIRKAEDVLQHRLIHDRGTYWWAEALKVQGLSLRDCKANLTLHRTYLCMHAAARGLGVAIGDTVSSAALLRQGQLVRPCGPDLAARMNYYLLVPEVRPLPPAVLATLEWLRRIADDHRAWCRSWQT